MLRNLLILLMSFIFVNSVFAGKDPKSVILKQGDVTLRQLVTPGFENLPANRKLFVYFLSKALDAGHEISWKQGSRDGIKIRNLLLSLWEQKELFSPTQKSMLEEYLTILLANKGNYEGFGNEKVIPVILNEESLIDMASKVDNANKYRGAPSVHVKTSNDLSRAIFDKTYFGTKHALADDADKIAETAVNYYGQGVTQKDIDKLTPAQRGDFLSYPVKVDEESIYLRKHKIGERFSKELTAIHEALEEAKKYGDKNEKAIISAHQKAIRTGKHSDVLAAERLWVQHQPKDVDFHLGFTEVYDDPINQRGSWEGMIFLKITDEESDRRSKVIRAKADYFESQMPVDKRFKKAPGFTPPKSEGAYLVYSGGDVRFTPFAGVNLPNDADIRAEYGSKSFTTINTATDIGASKSEKALATKNSIYTNEIYKPIYARVDDDLVHLIQVEFHEILGHGSGQNLPGINAEESLLELYNAMEEARAEVSSLYHLLDENLFNLKVFPVSYTQAQINDARTVCLLDFFQRQIGDYVIMSEETDKIKQAHKWGRQVLMYDLIEKGGLKVQISDKNVPQVILAQTEAGQVDFKKIRTILADSFEDIQEVKSTGSYEKTKEMFFTRGDYTPEHREWRKLLVDSGKAKKFRISLNPKMQLVKDKQGNIIDVTLGYYNSANLFERFVSENAKETKRCLKLFGSYKIGEAEKKLTKKTK